MASNKTHLSIVNALEKGSAVTGRVELEESITMMNRFMCLNGKTISFRLESVNTNDPNASNPEMYSIRTSYMNPVVNLESSERAKIEDSKEQPLLVELTPHPLGSGGFGSCFRSMLLEYNDFANSKSEPLVFKQINMADDRKDSYENEIKIMKKLSKQPSCDQIINFYFGCPCDIRSMEENTVYKFNGIAMELSNGLNLLHYMQKVRGASGASAAMLEAADNLKRPFPLDEFLVILEQSFNALEFMHSRDVIHCDIKLENIMWDKRLRKLKFIDFGLSLDKDDATAWQCCGTIDYMAPEILNGKPEELSDIWSMGISLACLLLLDKPHYRNKRYLEFIKANPEANVEQRRRKRKDAVKEELLSSEAIGMHEELYDLSVDGNRYCVIFKPDDKQFYQKLMHIVAGMIVKELNDRQSLKWLQNELSDVSQEYRRIPNSPDYAVAPVLDEDPSEASMEQLRSPADAMDESGQAIGPLPALSVFGNTSKNEQIRSWSQMQVDLGDEKYSLVPSFGQLQVGASSAIESGPKSSNLQSASGHMTDLPNTYSEMEQEMHSPAEGHDNLRSPGNQPVMAAEDDDL